MAINYGAGFLPQNLYQNLFDAQRRGIEEERRRQREPFQKLGQAVGQFGGMIAGKDIKQSKEAEDSFIKDMDDQIKDRQETLKKYDPQADPAGFNALEQELSSLRQEKQNRLQQFRGSGFLGMGRERSDLTVAPAEQGKISGYEARKGLMSVPGFQGRISESAYDPSGIKRKAREKEVVGDVETDVLERREGALGRMQQVIKKEVSKDTEYHSSELDNMVNKLLAQGEIANITATDLYESRGDYDHRQLVKRLTEIEPIKLQNELKKIGALAEPQAKSAALRALLVGEVTEKFTEKAKQKDLKRQYGDLISEFADDGAMKDFYGNDIGIKDLDIINNYNKIQSEALAGVDAGLQEIEVPGEGKISINAFKRSEEYADLKQRGLIDTDIAVARAEKLAAVQEKFTTEAEQRKLYRQYGDEILDFDDDGRPLNFYGEPTSLNELSLTKQTNEIFNKALSEEKAGQQKIEVPGKGEMTLNEFRQTREYADLKAKKLIETEAIVARQKKLTPGKIEELRQTLRTNLNVKEDEFYSLGQKEREARISDAVELAERIGAVELADDLKRLGAADNETFSAAKNRVELERLVDELEIKSEVKLDEAENMSAVLNRREADRLEIKLTADIKNWETLGLRQKQDILQLEIDKAKELGAVENLQELERISILEPMKQKQALQLYKDKRLADINAQSGARIREIIEKAGKDITDEEIKTLSDLGSSPSEKILLSEFGKASKKSAERKVELQKLSLPDNVISPYNKFQIARTQYGLPADMTYENSQAKLSLITNLINSGEAPSEEMLKAVGMGGMADEVNKVVKKKKLPFQKEALMNNLLGLVESSVAEKDGKPDQAKREEAFIAFQALSKDPDTKKLLDLFGYNESWFKGQSSVKLRTFTKDLASLRQTNSQTALNLAKESYTKSQVPKLTPAQQEKAARAKQYRDKVGDLITKQIEAEGRLNMDVLKEGFQALKMEFFPEMKEAARKDAGKAVVRGYLNRVPDGTKEQVQNVLDTMQVKLSDDELDTIFSELKPGTGEKSKAPPEVGSNQKTKSEDRAQLTKLGRPPDHKPMAQLFWDIANTLAPQGSMGEYLFK